MESSQADLIREHIVKKISEGLDYKNRSIKRADIKEFMESHLELKGTEKNISDHFGKILKSIAKENKIPAEQVGIKQRVPKVDPAMNQSDMQATIQPRPQDAQDNLAGAPVQSQIAVIAQPSQPFINPNITSEMVGSIVQGGLTGIKAILPELELFSEQEQKSIGNMWLPSVQRIQDERVQLYVIPLFGTVGIVGPKFGRAIKERKKRKQEEKNKLELKKSQALSGDLTNQDRTRDGDNEIG